jgi:TonB family protein
MSVNDRQAAKQNNQDKYEAAVLDFLDKEMAAVQPTKKGKEQTEELDALVSDLLKQVTTELDQPASNKAASDEINKLISELAPLRETAPPPEKKAAAPDSSKASSHAENLYPVPAASKKGEAEKPAIIKPKVGVAPAAKTPQAPAASIFAVLFSSKNRIPVIAAAVVCLLLAIGIPVYFMKGSSTPATNSAAAPSAAVTPVAPAAVATATPAPAPQAAPAATKTTPAAAPAPSSKPSAAELKAAAQAQKQAAQAQKQSAPAAQPTPAPVNVPAPAPQAAPAAAQVAAPVQPAPAPAPAPVPEKPPVQIAENRAPAPLVVDRTPAPRIESNAAAVNSALDLQTPTATHTVPKVMVPATPVSQAAPRFPELALRSRASGVVVLDLDIDSNGKVTKATPVSGPELFHKEAINAVMKWKYKPATVGGSNVPSQSRVTLNFKLPN